MIRICGGYMLIVGCMLFTVRWNTINGKLSGLIFCGAELSAYNIHQHHHHLPVLQSMFSVCVCSYFATGLACILCCVNMLYSTFYGLDAEKFVPRPSYIVATVLLFGGLHLMFRYCI